MDTTTGPSAGRSGTFVRTCPLCEATCGLQMTLHDGRVIGVRGDDQDVLSRGYVCPKGATFGQLVDDPDRVSAPRVSGDGGAWREVGWGEAFAQVERRLHEVVDEHGPDAVGVYLGNPNVHTLAGQLYVRPLVKALGTRNVFSASTVDQMPKHVACGLMFGHPSMIPVPDVDRTGHLLILGGNPRMSNGSLWTAPDLPRRLDALRDRGGRLVVVDPRRTRTAEEADEHLPIRPGTDAYLLAAMVTTLFEEGLVDLGRNAGHVSGVGEVRDALAAVTPEVAAGVTGIAATTTRRLARELAAARRPCVYGRLGTHTTRYGTLAAWLVDVLNTLVGALDRPGGAMFTTPAHRYARPRRPYRRGRWHSRVRGLPEANSELPVATLAEEIETPGEGRIRALVTIAGNPVRSTPNAGRLEAALGQLDLLVCVDPYVTATSRHADVLLPPPDPLAGGHYDLAFTELSIRDVANYSPPVRELAEGALHEWEILLTLAGIALGRPDLDVDAADAFVAAQLAQRVVSAPSSRLHGIDVEAALELVTDRRGPERLLDLLLRAGPYGAGVDGDGLSMPALEAAPHGIDLGALRPRLPELLATASGKVELAPQEIVADVPRLVAGLDDLDRDGFVLVGRRHLRTNNSWGQNVAALARGRDLATLHVNPDDAARLGLTDGGWARVNSRVGQVEACVEVTDAIMTATCSPTRPTSIRSPATRSSTRSRSRSPPRERPGARGGDHGPTRRPTGDRGWRCRPRRSDGLRLRAPGTMTRVVRGAPTYAPGMIRTPGQAMQHLRGMAISGRLDVFCEAHGLRLLVVFGSVIEPDGRRPGDLDLAVRLGAGSDVVALTSALVAETACDEVDLLDLDRAGIVARANALGRCLPLFEDEPGGYTRAAMAALGLAADTAWIRRLQLERLAS